jgi:hypothetical protein
MVGVGGSKPLVPTIFILHFIPLFVLFCTLLIARAATALVFLLAWSALSVHSIYVASHVIRTD